MPFIIFFGKHSELRERALQDQIPRSSALNILLQLYGESHMYDMNHNFAIPAGVWFFLFCCL
ncbi:hypothetical protein BCK_09820 [Bacillus cereus FRI-35]|nr:hypothetical protein BCK_09820 [Bacillus cereus FRI-35]